MLLVNLPYVQQVESSKGAWGLRRLKLVSMSKQSAMPVNPSFFMPYRPKWVSS